MKVHIEFDKEGIKTIDAVKKQLSVKTRTDVIKNSVALFSWVTQQIADGFNIIAIKDGESHGRELCLPILEKLKKKAREQIVEEEKPSACPECQLEMPANAIFCMNCGADLKESLTGKLGKDDAGKKPSLGRGITSGVEDSFEGIIVQSKVTVLGACPLCGKEILHDDKHYQCSECDREFFCEDHYQAADHVCFDCLAKLETFVGDEKEKDKVEEPPAEEDAQPEEALVEEDEVADEESDEPPIEEEELPADEADEPEESVDRKSTRLNSSHIPLSRMPSSA